jgi:hypothetical protein
MARGGVFKTPSSLPPFPSIDLVWLECWFRPLEGRPLNEGSYGRLE